jgi:uncharacterized OsmC-like protein
MTAGSKSIVRQRQDPLRERYRSAANEAWIKDSARSLSNRDDDPFHGVVIPGEARDAQWRFGIHQAIGGDHDLPNPGDILCTALVACLDATLRMIADRLGIRIESLEVAATAEVDVRGTLVVDRSVPVGFQRIGCRVQIQPADCGDPEKLQKLVAAAEYSCVVLQTLRSGVEVRTQFDVSRDDAQRDSETRLEKTRQ